MRTDQEVLTAYEEAELELAAYRIPAEVFEAARALPEPPDLSALAAELDRFTAYGYGHATKSRFLRGPYPERAGVQAYELLREPGGGELLLEYVRETLRKEERVA